MAQYTVRNKKTNQTITFNWKKDTPPTGDDMKRVFERVSISQPQTDIPATELTKPTTAQATLPTRGVTDKPSMFERATDVATQPFRDVMGKGVPLAETARSLSQEEFKPAGYRDPRQQLGYAAPEVPKEPILRAHTKADKPTVAPEFPKTEEVVTSAPVVGIPAAIGLDIAKLANIISKPARGQQLTQEEKDKVVSDIQLFMLGEAGISVIKAADPKSIGKQALKVVSDVGKKFVSKFRELEVKLGGKLGELFKNEDIANAFGAKLKESVTKEQYNDIYSKAPKVLKNVMDDPTIAKKVKPVKVKSEISTSPIKDTINKNVMKVREAIDDDWIRVKKLVQSKGAKVSEISDPYKAETRYWGRVGSRVSDIETKIDDIDKQILGIEKITGNKKVNKDINEYLVALHAGERNKVLGERAAGISTKEAGNIITKMKGSKDFSKINEVATNIKKMNDGVLDTMLESGLISKEKYNSLRKVYPNHVPLNRILPEDPNFVEAISGRGFGVKGSGLKRAKGSELEVSDILGNVAYNLQSATLRAEKNIVDNATLKFVRENNYMGGLFQEIKPKAIGKTFKGDAILSKVDDPLVLSLMENGKPVHLKINDPLLAAALKGENRAKIEGFVRGAKTFTRLYSSLATRFNPDFLIPNKIRDIQETAVYLLSKKKMGAKGLVKTIKEEPKSVKAVYDFIRGKDTPDTKLFNQMRLDGGTTGGLGLSTREQVNINIDKIRSGNRNAFKKGLNNVLKFFDDTNSIFEDSTRFSVYKAALKSGVSRNEAAVLAKNASLNFNKMGTTMPIINSLYMFSNASVRGSMKTLKALSNPKVAGTTISAIGGSIMAVDKYNDNIDKNWKEKVSKWDKLNGINVVISSDDKEGIKYITMPVSWSLKPIKVMLESMINIAGGEDVDFKEALTDITAAVAEGYNPVGGQDVPSIVSPTFFDIPLEIMRNKTWAGGKIRPEWNPSQPESIKYFDSLRKRATGRASIATTRWLGDKGIEISPADMNYALRQYMGGAGRFTEKTIKTIYSAVEGEEIEGKEVPFVGRFYRGISKEDLNKYKTDKDFDRLKDMLKKQDKERFYFSQQAELIYDGMKELPEDQFRKRFNEIASQNPDLGKKIEDIKESDGLKLTYTDRLIKNLGVKNGYRASFINRKMAQLKTKKERDEYFNSLINKKIITKKVKGVKRY